jgi:hypothetical protein
MTHALAALAGLVLIGLMLAEFFISFLLPRRVKREVRIARGLNRIAWRPWRALGRRLPAAAGDTLLGFYGPLALIATLAVWSIGLIVGFALLQWANGSHVGHNSGFGNDLYFSAGGFLSAASDLAPRDTIAKLLLLGEAAGGLGIVFIIIGYLPALNQAFSRREIAVSQLDPRAGSPPTAGALLLHAANRGGWAELNDYLQRWEEWAAELMETHLSYPILMYFRSQHVNQNWLAALTTILDTSAFAIAAAPGDEARAADTTFALGRHALADLSYTIRAGPRHTDGDRLPTEELERLVAMLDEAGLPIEDSAFEERLRRLRHKYEPYAVALAGFLELSLPRWLPPDQPEANWRRPEEHLKTRRQIAGARR